MVYYYFYIAIFNNYIKMRKEKLSFIGISLLLFSFTLTSCSKSDNATEIDASTEGSVSVTSTVQSKYTTAVAISTSGNTITLKSNGTPNHLSPYWGVGKPQYEAPRTGYTVNPGIISEHTLAMTIPTNPASATIKEETALGAIGMALNGVPIYNDREGGNVPVDAMILTSFDRGGAHVGPSGYHYHVSGEFTTTDDANLVGFLRDGFPIYGRKDKDGTYPTNLDAYGGHTSVTADFPTGIYHYHCSNVNYLNAGVYILKSGSYYGTKGTFTN
jgi:hypothetical protein